jgi:very-short-patch-repair endonuclease
MPEQLEHDTMRTQFLDGEGFRVLRFWNAELNDNFDGVMEILRLTLESAPHPLSSG